MVAGAKRMSVVPRLAAVFVALVVVTSPAGCRRDGSGEPPRSTPDGTIVRAEPERPAESATPNTGDAAVVQIPEPPLPPAPPPVQPDLAPDRPCVEPDEVALFVSPRRPLPGVELRIMVVSDADIPGATIWARDPAGTVRQVDARRFGGPPYAWSAAIPSPAEGVWRVALTSGSEVRTCEDIRTRATRAARRVRENVWPVEDQWDRRFENLYSAWIMQLFASDPGERPSWRPLHEVFRDPQRNWLYNRLGIDEDGPDPDDSIRATPDCADTPYFLRAYFAWKMRLLFTFSACTRGRGGAPPTCSEMRSNLDPPLEGFDEAGIEVPDGGVAELTEDIEEGVAFNAFLNRVVASTVQSGCGRTLPDDDHTDLYPITLSRESIRPGTVFVDPYGHLLVVAQWVDQGGTASGMLFAVDGHPDLSIGRKRFWQGAFLFLDDLSWGAGGFKAFRPAFVQRRSGENRIDRLTNEEINANPDWGNYSAEQYRLGVEGFYERMDRVINPRPLDPDTAHTATLDAFYELVQERIDSVVAGEEYMAGRGFEPISMPDGPEIFETSGAWEDYSTPARDLRLLIAIDIITRFPGRVIARPAGFAIPAGQTPESVADRLRRRAAEYLAGHAVTYIRSNGREQRLTLAAMLERQAGLEMAYNPNDCIEIRWAAPEGGEEMSSCRRHAPEEQLERMRRYRPWFHDRARPPRE